MRLRILPSLSLSLLLLAWPDVRAQLVPADDYFHGGAQFYLSNNIPAALQTVTNGLEQFPNDEKLGKLYELLNQQQQRNQQDQEQQDQQQQDQQQDQNRQDQQQQNQQDQENQEQQQQAGNKSDQPQPPQDQQQADTTKQTQGDQRDDEPSQPLTARAMSPEEAQQLLDSLKGDEAVLQFQPQAERNAGERKLNDW